MSSNVMQLVSVPTPSRTCPFCAGPLTAIELWHDCSERRLAYAREILREARINRRVETMKRVSRAQLRARA